MNRFTSSSLRERALATLLLAAVAGCGAAGEEAAPTPDQAQEPQGETVAQAEDGALVHYGSEEAARLRLSEPFTGDFEAMLERRHVRALVAYSQTSYFMDGLRQRGVAYDLLKQFEEYINEQHGGDVPILVIPIPATRAEMMAGLAAGRGDIALGGLTITDERAAVVDFSDPFIGDVAEIIVSGPAGAPVDTLDDLAGRAVYVRPSSSYFTSLQALNEDFTARGLAPVELIEAEEHLEDEDLLEMVNTGLVELIVVDEYKAEFWDQIFDSIQLHPDVALRTDGEIAWAFRQDSPQLAGFVNEFVKDHRKGTLMGNMLFNRYLRDTRYVENAIAGDSRERFRDTVEHFREFAAQYDFDYLMMVAQGYQESKLDQSLVSHRGAVGIMQLLPTTAAARRSATSRTSTSTTRLTA
ncbi:MAG: transporter substrate-binding domain-containing protein [Acidobacteria bacterium]|nr:transporter substrate-binding domain-containing protein [Acidobacteriota bacterium]